MFSFDMFRYDVDLQQRMENIINARRSILFEFVVKGIENKEFSEDTDPQAFTDVLFGVIWSTTFVWQMGGCTFDLKDRIMKAVNSILGYC